MAVLRLVGGRLRVLWLDDALMRVCPETIYRWIYSNRTHRKRWAHRLPRGHRYRRRHADVALPAPCRIPISKRPPETGDRSGFDH